MGKNKKFSTTYTIKVEGVTTNGYADRLVDKILYATVKVINQSYKQINAYIIKEIKNGRN